jgi:3-phenylpropionate/trans-cinnamate dioxygenase ferredoxin reductase subunit
MEKLVAADCVNRPQEFMVSKKLISEGVELTPEQLANESIALKALLDGARSDVSA